MKYKGSCHCGKIAFEVEGEINGAMACNCSMCSRKRSLLWFVPRDQLHLLTAEEDIGTRQGGFVDSAGNTWWVATYSS